MGKRDPLRVVRRSSEGRRWTRRGIAELLGVTTRQVDNYKQRGQLKPCESAGGTTEFANEEVLRFLLEDYHATKRGGEVARG